MISFLISDIFISDILAYVSYTFLPDNPKCADAPGCGTWKAPQIKNPKYKGKWRAPMIDNPNYKVNMHFLISKYPGLKIGWSWEPGFP